MSFGFSVGDFITAIELANRIRKEFVDAPSQFKAISDDLRSLSIVLQDVEIVIPGREVSTQQQTELQDIVEGCRNVLKNLNETLGTYQELDSNPKTFGRKARRVWKRLKWEPEDIKELRSRIIANIALLNAFQGRLDSQISLATKDGVDRLHERQDDQERRTILDWLTPIDYGTQQSDFISRRQEGTGQWLLNSDEFQTWLNRSKQTLFCPGIPGAGKTMITSIVIDHLWAKFRNDVNIGIAYLYCNFRRQHEQKPGDLLASVLKQLIQERSPMPESVTNLYKRHKDKRTRPSFDEISKILYFVVADYSRIFIIIDALDECQASDSGWKKLWSDIINFQAEIDVNLFTTSRFIPEIEKEFKESISLEIRATNEDVRKYLDSHVSQLSPCVLRSPALQEKIKAEIMTAVDGMFLLAQLHLDSLADKPTPKAIRLALERLPKGSDALDHAYQEAMERIKGQKTGFQELAMRALTWITCVKRPLTTLEIRHALAVETGDSELDEENLPEIEDVISVCAGLVAVDEKSDIIRLVHHTTQIFFERVQKSWFPNAQNYITKTCVTYLSFDALESGFCPTDKEFEVRLRTNPLYDYAAQNWGYHACAATTEVEYLVLGFLESASKVSSASQAMIVCEGEFQYYYMGYSQNAPRQMIGVHLGAYFGMKEAMKALLENGRDLNSTDEDGRTPLSWAAGNGHETVVKMLLTKDGIDPDPKDTKCGQTPLSWAAGNGHKAVMKLLLATNGVDPDSKDDNGQTPLSMAASRGHEAAVRLLLATDSVDPDSKDTYDQTPLSWAAAQGNEAVVELLLRKNCIQLNSKTKDYRTPLSWAAGNGHEAVVKLLLAIDNVDPDSKDTYDQTPLSWAAAQGHEAVVELLLRKNCIQLNSKTKDYRTPLSWAAENGHEKVVKLLLDRDSIDLNSKDTQNGLTPLLWAAANGHETVVKLLLATEGVDPDSKNQYGWTPLSRAAATGHEEVVKLLLDKDGVDPDFKDQHNRTPLSQAAMNGDEAIVKVLLAMNNVNSDSKDQSGRTPLSWAAESGHEGVVKLLLDKDGVDPDSKDQDGRTPLSQAAANGHEAVVRLLLAEEIVDLNSKDIRYGQTPLSWAVENRCEAVVKLLLANDGVDPNFKDNNGRTPLSSAAGKGDDTIIKLFLAKDVVHLDSKDRYGQTPLLLAAGNGHVAVVKLLLAKDVMDPYSKDKFGRTPLSWAARRGNSDIVKLLLEKCEENGIVIRKGDVNIVTSPAADPESSRLMCDICMSRIPNVDIHDHCQICSGGDFDICQECMAIGALCLNDSHKLVKRTVEDGDYLELPA